MRAFISVDLPEEFKEYLISLQKKIKNGSFSFAKQFHITLKFLDEIDEKKKDEIIEKLRVIKFPAFDCVISHIDFFAHGKDIRVVWIGAKPHEKFNFLVLEIDNALKGMFKKDDFVAHVTLARVKFLPDRNKFLDELKQIKTKDMTFRVDKFVLKKSTLTGEGPVYEDLKEFKLV